VIDGHPNSALGEALRFVQVGGIFYCPSLLNEPWGLELPAIDECVWFHAVTEGTCTIEADGQICTAGRGDLILVPHGTGHLARGREPAPTPSVFDLEHEHEREGYARLRHGGDGSLTQLVCGGVRLMHPAASHLVEALPSVIHVEAARATRADWIQTTLELLADEMRTVRPGNQAVISRLCDIVVIQAIRSWIENDPTAQTGWLGALQDDRIGSAITAIHAKPELEWSVASLADHVGMSRSGFAARFTTLVGEPAMSYVTKWRMSVAQDLLQAGELSTAAIAQQVGYQSEAAFSRAFKRTMGVSPRHAHRNKRAALVATSKA